MPRDSYEVLGVPRSASAEEIRKAHRRLVRTLHPDVNKSPDAAKQFAEVQEAYDILSDPAKRARYDQFGHAGVGGAGPGGGGPGGFGGAGGADAWQEVDPETFQTIFENFGDFFSAKSRGGAGAGSGAGRRGGRRAGQGFGFSGRSGAGEGFGESAPGADAAAETTVAFETAALGGTAQLSLQTAEGKSERLDVKIPAGLADGARLRIRGKGHPSPHGSAPGDLVLTVRVAPHPWFRREDLDIVLEVPVTIAEAALGASVDVPLLRGSATLKIPPGVASGRRLRLKGKGITDASGRSGDFHAVLVVAAPEGLDAEDRAALERMSQHLPDPRRRLWS